MNNTKAKEVLEEMGIEISETDKEYGKMISRLSTELIVYRHEHNLTQKQLAEKLGVNQPYLSKIENGEKNLSMWKIAEIITKLKGSITISFGIAMISREKESQAGKQTDGSGFRSASGF